MAGGKLSPRQKMINLMYLIFIAMLAMQMDKKVLSSFGFMKEKIEDANVASSTNINNILSSLKIKASEQPDKFGDENNKAQQINQMSNDLYQYMAALKDSLLADTDEEDKTNYESMSNGDRLDEMFFKGDGFTQKGQDFVDRINSYRDTLLSVLGTGANPDLITNIRKRFNTDPEPATEEGSPDIPWLKSRYEGMPMITSLANMTQIQGDIKNTEAEIYTNLLGGQLKTEASMSNYNGIVNLGKNAYYPGESVKGSVVLGRYDPTLKPSRVDLNGQDYKNFKDGEVVLDFRAGGIGEKKIKGTIYFMEDGVEIPVPFENTYSVIPKPNNAVVSADKMNVLYRGLNNPVSVSLPGISENAIKVTATNSTKTGANGSYMFRPGSGDKVTITVSATLPNGTPVSSDKEFRVKDIPAAAGTVRDDFGVVRMPKTSLGRTPIGAALPDFVFDLKLDVLGFTIKVPGQLAVKVNGTQLDARAKAALAKSRRGDVITIFDIKAVESKSRTPIKKVLPVSIEISN
ncbi:MAG: gliding motility protein GldM [Flavobacteriaceae bacterium]